MSPQSYHHTFKQTVRTCKSLTRSRADIRHTNHVNPRPSRPTLRGTPDLAGSHEFNLQNVNASQANGDSQLNGPNLLHYHQTSARLITNSSNLQGLDPISSSRFLSNDRTCLPRFLTAPAWHSPREGSAVRPSVPSRFALGCACGRAERVAALPLAMKSCRTQRRDFTHRASAVGSFPPSNEQ